MFKLFAQLINWLYKKTCFICKKETENSSVCECCIKKLGLLENNLIRSIGDINVYSAGMYGGNLKQLIKGLKYKRKKDLATFLAVFMLKALYYDDNQELDYEIVPVPMFKKRKRQRGYNHMELIADEIRKVTGFPVNNNLIKRIKNTKPQYNLSKKERLKNLKNAFDVDITTFSGKKLLIIDDIYTTGSTIEEMIRQLKKHNIQDITVLVAATPS